MALNDRKSVMQSLGEFVGHIWQGVKSDPSPRAGRREVVRRETCETHRPGEADRPAVTLRRTTIDEIEIHPKEAGS